MKRNIYSLGLAIVILMTAGLRVQAIVTLNSDVSNYTFENGVTYLIANTITISGTTTIQGGAIIKYASGASINADDLVCPTSSGTPAILTSMNDDTVGATIPGSNHSPTYSDYGAALNFARNTITTVKNLNISYADTGLYFLATVGDYEATNYVQNVVIEHCGGSAIFNIQDLYSSDPYLILSDSVIDDIAGTALSGDFWRGYANNITVSNANLCEDTGYGYEDLYITNSKFDTITEEDFEDIGLYLSGDNNGFHDSDPFGTDSYSY